MTIGIFFFAELVSTDGDMLTYRFWPDDVGEGLKSALFEVDSSSWTATAVLPRPEDQRWDAFEHFILPKVRDRTRIDGAPPSIVRYIR